MEGAGAGAELRAAAIAIDAAEVARAAEGFHHAAPKRSAKRVLHWAQAFVFMLLVCGATIALENNASRVWRYVLWSAYGLFVCTIAWRLVAAAILQPLLSRIAEPAPHAWPIYTILCPLRREGAVVLDLVAALDRLDYPHASLDIKLLVEADDPDTLAYALAAAAGRAHIEILIIPAAAPRTKPKALNVGSARARGEYLAVYDAEDRPHPLQLRAALAAFEDKPDLACVQAPLVIDNASANWITRQFAAEYAIQFRQVLPLLARFGLPLPLGGSSNHFRTAVLNANHGWDPCNVTEDADLGYRLARAKWRSGIIAPPTWEEAPTSFAAWRKQRARWIKGHMQTWLVLMRDPIGAARDMGLGAFISMQLILGGGVAAALLHGPMAIVVIAALISPANVLGVTGFALALCGYCVGVFATLSAAALSGDVSHVRAAPTMPFYWPLASIAAAAALFDLIVRPHHWAKTAHGLSERAHFPFNARREDAPALEQRGSA